ncbi:stable inheritance protein KleA [Pseudomonas corrugata]|nr:stable inheritance protein KleA [Pseudomonas corrugata]MBI6621553.1 stable inheritance protein KleA [Pseudomonas corrugata]
MSTLKTKFVPLAWVRLLPEKILEVTQAHDELCKIVEEAERLELEAAVLRQKAYLKSLAVEATARKHWTVELIDRLRTACAN